VVALKKEESRDRLSSPGSPGAVSGRAWRSRPADGSSGFDYPAGFDAVGAHQKASNAAVMDRPDPLQVWFEATLGDVVGMTDIIAHHRFLAAYRAHLGHGPSPLNFIKFSRLQKISTYLKTRGL
jgi:hypothetical protein